MSATVKRFVRLFAGFLIMSIGMVLSNQSNFGMAPWDVLNEGVSKILPITFGQASIVIGLVILLFDFFAKEKLGFGTLFNIMCLGFMFDGIQALGIIPDAVTLTQKTVMCIASIPFSAVGMYFYMSAGLGAGPRDTLMVAVTKKVKRASPGACRFVIEAVALAVGFAMGGTVGFGTVILVFCNPTAMQYVFKLFKFDVRTNKNQTFTETVNAVKTKTTAKAMGTGS